MKCLGLKMYEPHGIISAGTEMAFYSENNLGSHWLCWHLNRPYFKH